MADDDEAVRRALDAFQRDPSLRGYFDEATGTVVRITTARLDLSPLAKFAAKFYEVASEVAEAARRQAMAERRYFYRFSPLSLPVLLEDKHSPVGHRSLADLADSVLFGWTSANWIPGNPATVELRNESGSRAYLRFYENRAGTVPLSDAHALAAVSEVLNVT